MEKEYFEFKNLKEENIEELLSLQDENTTPDVYVKITREEFCESFVLDEVVGAYRENELAGFCLIIKNRQSDRNLAPDIDAAMQETVTFDAVVVKKKFRGNFLQKRFIALACERAKKYEPKPRFIAATVSPFNAYSRENFLQSGFTVRDEKEKYGGNLRLVVAKNI